MAYVLIKSKPGTSKEVTACRTIRGVRLASDVLGRYDAVIVISAKDMNELARTIYEAIEKLPNVERTETLISIFPPEAPKERAKERGPSVVAYHCYSCGTLNSQDAHLCSLCGVPLR